MKLASYLILLSRLALLSSFMFALQFQSRQISQVVTKFLNPTIRSSSCARIVSPLFESKSTKSESQISSVAKPKVSSAKFFCFQPVSTVANRIEAKISNDAFSKLSMPCLDTTNAEHHDIQNEVSFTVYGEPVALQRHRTTKFGMTYNPSSKQQSEFLKACEQHLPAAPMEGPLEVRLVFYFSRPLSHYGTGRNANVLKPGMEHWHSKKKGEREDIDRTLCCWCVSAIR